MEGRETRRNRQSAGLGRETGRAPAQRFGSRAFGGSAWPPRGRDPVLGPKLFRKIIEITYIIHAKRGDRINFSVLILKKCRLKKNKAYFKTPITRMHPGLAL
jgi:hypothetical protein